MLDRVFGQARHAAGQSVVLQQRAARESAKPRSNRLGENRREAIIFRRHDEQGLSGYRQGQKGMVGAARFQRETQSCGSMLSTSMDSLAVSLQSGSTNYESNSTPVPEIVNQSRNCATGKSLDFNERESHKLRLSDRRCREQLKF
jgi:hypothetical protein